MTEHEKKVTLDVPRTRREKRSPRESSRDSQISQLQVPSVSRRVVMPGPTASQISQLEQVPSVSRRVVMPGPTASQAQIINAPTYTHREDDNNYIGDVSMDHLERMVWSRKLEFILSCLGYAVGLGNLWRFPYMCYRNGGGAFFIPYLIMLLFCGFPLFYLEISLGQFASLGPLSVWKVSPLFKGVGYGIVTVSLMVSIYYNMIIGWSIFYLFASMQDPVPWSTCDNWWNTPACTMDGRQYQNASNNSTIILNSVMGNISLNDSADVGDIIVSLDPYENVTQNLTYVGRLKSSSEEYFYNYVLGITDDISDFGGMQWYNVGCLCLAWLLVFLALRKGIKTSGKVVYFTAIFPYVVLVILLIRGVSLDGAVEGIKFFLIPKWERLRQAKVWNDAAIQVFYSLGSCFGTLITLASYNKFHNNCYKDAVIVCVGNTLTSVLGGVVIFSILGYMAHVSGTTVDKVAQEGSGLAFVVYPEVVAKFPVSPLWAILFFIMLLTLGLDSQFGMIETLVTAILEEYPKQCHKRKTWVILGVCIVMFILGLPLCTKGGMYWLHLMDLNAAGWSVLILGLFECLVIGWVYGYNRFADNIQMMIGKKPSLYWRALWQFVTPVIILFILVFSWVDYSPAYYDQYEYPFWANLLGGAMTCLPLVPLPIWMLYAISKTDGPIKRRIQLLTQPAADWGPGPSIDEDIVAFLSPNTPYYLQQSTSTLTFQRHLSGGIDNKGFEPSLDFDLDSEITSTSTVKLDKTLSALDVKSLASQVRGRDQSQTESAMEDFRGVIEAETSWADVHSGEDENKERGNWTSRVEFFLACLGYAVGLGNIWRFPYLVYRNGGGAFFIPFVIMLLFIGVPLFYLELAFGQFASLGPITIWKVSPIFKGVGYAMVIVSSLVAIYYNVIIAWTLYYLFASMTADLPWAHCNNTWNTPLCSENAYSIQSNLTTTTTAAPTKSTPLSSVLTDSNLTSSLPNISSVNLAAFLASNTTQSPDTEVDIGETITTAITAVVNATLPQFRSPSEEYFSLHVLSKSEGIQDLGGMKWHILLCLTLAWILVFVCLIKGIKSSGKVVYFTATFPYILLFILFIRGVTLSGFEDGIRYYFTPQWEKLASAQVWKDAAVQIFFSLSTCWGGLITLASYNKFHNNCYRDAVIIALGNGATCVFAGLVIFAIMGVMAHEMGTTIDKVISEEVGLAFVIYPDAVLRMPVSPLWSILFFFMLLFVGLDTQFAIVETVSTAIADEFPHKFDNTKPRRKVLLILVLCLIYFFLGLPMCTQGGIYLMQLMDHYAASWSVLIIGICECVALSWVYGVDRFGADIKAMIGREPSFMWKCLWRLITPIIITFVLVFSLADYTAASYVEYSFPLWADIMGWMMALVSIVVIPVWAVYIICRAHGSLCERLRVVSHHTVDWGPALEQHRLFIAQLPRMYNYYLNALSEDSTTEFEGIQSSVDLTVRSMRELLRNGQLTEELTVRSMREMLRNHQLAEQEKKRKASLSSVPAKRPSTKTRKTSPSGSSSTNKSDLITRDMPPEYQKAIEEGEMILVRKPKKPVPMEDKCIQTDPVSNGGLKNTPNGNVQGSSINNTTIGGDTVTASGEKILNSCLKKGGNSKKRRGRNIRVCKVEIESPTSEQVKDSSAFAVENEMSSLPPTRSKASSPRSNSHLLPSNKPQSSVPVTGTPSHHHSNSSLNSKHSETSTARPMAFHSGNGDSHEEHCPLSTKLDLSLNSSGDSIGANEQIHCLCNRKGSPRQAHFSIGNQPVAQSSQQTANSAASCNLDNNDDDDRFEETQM